MKGTLLPGRFVVGSEGGKIGVAVRKQRGFEFRSDHVDFAALDGRHFRRARSLVNEVARLARTARLPAISARRHDSGLW